MRLGKRAAALAAAGSLAAAGVAGGAHWPMFGGDPGRSGNNDDAGSPPATVKWTEDAEARIATPIVVSGGSGDARRVVFGTRGGGETDPAQLHLRRIADGDAVAAVGVGNDRDAFGGTGPSTEAINFSAPPAAPPCDEGTTADTESCRYRGVRGAVAAVEASDGSGPGQVYQLYNRGTSILIAHVDAATGTPVLRTPRTIAGTGDYTIHSSPVLTPPDANGNRVLLFVASRDPSGGLERQIENRLFRVPIVNAASAGASIGPATSTTVRNANPFASPTLIYLRVSNSTIPYVLVSTGAGTSANPDNAVRAYRVGNLEPGPAVTGLDGVPYTPAVPPAPNGQPPGAAGSGSTGAQVAYVAIHTGSQTRVLRLRPSGSTFEVASSPALAGAPGPALAVDRLGTPSPSIAVTTQSGAHVLDAGNPGLPKVETSLPGNFRNAAPAIARGYVYLQGNGIIAARRAYDNSPAAQFEEPAPAPAGESRGQPALATGFAAFAVGTRVYGYELEPPPVPPNQPPTASFVLGPNPAAVSFPVGFDARGSSDPDGRIVNYRWDLDGDGTFERDTGDVPATVAGYPMPGTYDVGLQVTDDDGATDVTRRQLVVEAVERKEPRGLTVRVRPRSDTTTPHRFRTRGRLLLPDGVTESEGCAGRVTVVVKARRNTISRRAAGVRDDCRYRSRVTFTQPRRFAGVRRLRFIVRFRGNDALEPLRGKTRRVRVR